MYKISAHPDWLVHADVFEYPASQFASRRPVLFDMTTVDNLNSGEGSERWLLWSAVYLLQTLLFDSQDSIYIVIRVLAQWLPHR